MSDRRSILWGDGQDFISIISSTNLVLFSWQAIRDQPEVHILSHRLTIIGRCTAGPSTVGCSGTRSLARTTWVEAGMIMGSSSDINGKKDMVGGVAGPESVPEPGQMHKNKGPRQPCTVERPAEEVDAPGLGAADLVSKIPFLKRTYNIIQPNSAHGCWPSLALVAARPALLRGPEVAQAALASSKGQKRASRKAGADLGLSDDEQE
jgi:hypothetical protein